MDHLRALRILGLPPGSTPDEIQVAWRDLAKVWHPDRFAHDERLQQKAGENLGRINEAHETLRDYDPAKTPRMAARVRESVAIILGMGELGEPPPGMDTAASTRAAPAPPPPLVPRGPIGLRHSLRVLGLGAPRMTGETGTRRTSHGPGRTISVVLLLLVLAGVLLYLLR